MEFAEVIVGCHELWGSQVPSEIMGQAIPGSDAMWDVCRQNGGKKFLEIDEGEKLSD